MKALLTTLLTVIILSASATHNRSGEILYKRIAPFTQVVGSATVQVYTYSITVVKYTGDGVGIADRCVDTVYFGDGTKGVAPRINGLTNCNCGSAACGEIIVNSPGYRVKKNIYSVVHTYPGPGHYLIKSMDPNRTQDIHNILNSVNFPFYIESRMVINSSLGANSSPVLTNPPIKQGTVGVCFYDNPVAIDADGDSLSYEITTCRDQNGQTVAGYFFPEVGFNGTYGMNAVSGDLTWCVPQFLTSYSLAFLVKEWRKNTNGVYELIGYVERDFEVLVKYGIVGLKENEPETGVVYPNPFQSDIRIDLEKNYKGKTKISVYATDGKLVFERSEETTNGKLNLNLDGLEPAIYVLRIETDKSTVFKKLVKE